MLSLNTDAEVPFLFFFLLFFSLCLSECKIEIRKELKEPGIAAASQVNLIFFQFKARTFANELLVLSESVSMSVLIEEREKFRG